MGNVSLMGEWWQSIKLYQPIHFFQEVVERYGDAQVLRKAFIKGSGFCSEKIVENNYNNGDVSFRLRIRRNGYQVTKSDSAGTVTRFYYDLKEARELL